MRIHPAVRGVLGGEIIPNPYLMRGDLSANAWLLEDEHGLGDVRGDIAELLHGARDAGLVHKLLEHVIVDVERVPDLVQALVLGPVSYTHLTLPTIA